MLSSVVVVVMVVVSWLAGGDEGSEEVRRGGRETPPSAPAEGDVAWSVSSLLHQRFVELTAGARVDAGPAVLTIVLQARDVGTEERGELASTACALALVTHLIVQHVRLHLHLQPDTGRTVTFAVSSREQVQRKHVCNVRNLCLFQTKKLNISR